MPLQRFIPSSSDRYISNDKNQGAVKFGHLNAVVDYINENGGGAPAGAIGEVQFNGGGVLAADSNLYWDNTNKRLGVGTSAPVSKLETRTTDGFGAVRIYNNNDSSAPLHLLRANGGGVGINTFSSGGTINSPTDRGLGYLTRFTGQVYVDGAFRTAARIEYYLTSAPSAANLNCAIRFMTASPTTYTIEERVGITSDGNLQIGDSIVNNRNSKVFIQGSGSTSATTSLLVRNSSGTDLLKVQDDGNVGVGTNAPSEKFVIQNDNGNAILVVQANSAAVAQVKRYSNNGTRARYETYKSRGTIQAPLSIQTGDEIGSVDFYAYDGSAFQRNGIIYVSAESVLGGLITPTMKFGVGTSAGFNQYRLSIFNDGNISIGQETNASARLGIKGSGSTSATTSLLVQNSAGTAALTVKDDLTTTFGATIFGTNAVMTANVQFNNILYGTNFFSQNTGATTLGASAAADASAMLDIRSTSRGLLPPRMTTTQKNAISTPAAGLQVYDTTLNQMSYYNGTSWVNV